MSATFITRIENLERKLDVYQNRLEMEEKRRIILEDWIRMNFNFDVRLQLGNIQNPKTNQHFSSANKNKRKIGEIKKTSTNYGAQVAQVLPLPLPSGGANSNSNPQNPLNNTTYFSNQSTSTESNTDVISNKLVTEVTHLISKDYYSSDSQSGSDTNHGKESKRKKATKKDGQISAGRPRDSLWKYFRTVPILNPKSAVAADVHCSRCDKKVSPRLCRMQLHLSKCSGSESANYTQNEESLTQVNPNPNSIQTSASQLRNGSSTTVTGKKITEETMSEFDALSSTPVIQQIDSHSQIQNYFQPQSLPICPDNSRNRDNIIY